LPKFLSFNVERIKKIAILLPREAANCEQQCGRDNIIESGGGCSDSIEAMVPTAQGLKSREVMGWRGWWQSPASGVLREVGRGAISPGASRAGTFNPVKRLRYPVEERHQPIVAIDR